MALSCEDAHTLTPDTLLKDAGVDMTTGEPLRLTLQKVNRVMDEMERILAARKPRLCRGRLYRRGVLDRRMGTRQRRKQA